jgi:hypothetical protein
LVTASKEVLDMSIVLTITALFFGLIAAIATHGWPVLAVLTLIWIALVLSDVRPGALAAGLRRSASWARRHLRAPATARRAPTGTRGRVVPVRVPSDS